MNFANIPLFQVMQQKMQYHSARQAALAQNVANVDTPGYRAQDIQAPDFGALTAASSGQLALATTNAKHFPIAGMGKMGGNKLIKRDNTYELNPIGNNVVVEEEMMKVAENQADYQKTIGVYRKSLELFKIALGKGGGA